MDRLLEIGFERAGLWLLEEGELKLELQLYGAQKNILYAFVTDGQVKYVGKTIRTLAIRMAGYRVPGSTQVTNIKNNANIKSLLSAGAAVEIYALPDMGFLHYGKFHLNLAAALEDDIIRVIDPEWNGGKRETPTEQLPVAPALSSAVAGSEDELKNNSADSLHRAAVNSAFFLRPTYAKTGFFNVSVDVERNFGADGEKIEIFFGQSDRPILGSINRRANANGTPRIMGGAGLKRWFEEAARVDQKIILAILTPQTIRLEVA
ncbi:MAG: hypothetical protein JWN73_537 [Betaproteobacteria bacterium]|nr:hypothetical protein [Betaproteobacteria bacterium]